MTNQNLASYKDLFIKSSQDCINKITESFEKIKLGQDPTASFEVFHRNAHSLKGECLTMSFPNTSEYAKSLEYLAKSKMDNNFSPLTHEEKTDIEKIIGHIKESFDKIKNEDMEPNQLIPDVVKKYLSIQINTKNL